MCPVPVHDVAVGLLLLILATLVSFFRGLRLSSHIYTSALRAIAIAPFRTRHSLVVVFIGTVASLYLPSGVLTSHTAEGVTKCAGRFTMSLSSVQKKCKLTSVGPSSSFSELLTSKICLGHILLELS